MKIFKIITYDDTLQLQKIDFVIYTNFVPKNIPKNYEEISEEEYNQLLTTNNEEEERL